MRTCSLVVRGCNEEPAIKLNRENGFHGSDRKFDLL
jgi:hypothetical protein